MVDEDLQDSEKSSYVPAENEALIAVVSNLKD
jgi:hypothetical protein